MTSVNLLEVDKTEVDILKYEIHQLRHAHDLCVVASHNKRDIERSLFLEAFLLHARNMIDFLEGHGTRSDDLTIRDFKDSSGNFLETIDLGFDKELRDRIGKHCCHITKKRLFRKYAWKISHIKDKIEQGITKFIKLSGQNL